MDDKTASRMKRCRAAWTNKGQWVALYDDAYSLALPQRNTMRDQSAGQPKNTTVYDSILQKCTVRLAGTLQTSITPPATTWARIVPGPFVPPGPERNQLTVEYNRITNLVFAALQPSNFDSAIGEFFLDLIIGTAAMLVLDGGDKTPFQFIPVPISELALEEGAFNRIGGVFRKYRKPVRTLKEMWPDMKGGELYNKLMADDPGKTVEINEITCFDSEKDEWTYTIILGNSQSNDPESIVTRKYKTNPWIISRWIKVAGEVFGRGPVINALPDAKTANMAKKLELQNASLAIPGVWLAKNNGVLNGNAIKMTPGAIIPVVSTGGPQGADLVKLNVGGDLSYSQIVQKDLHEAIKDAMFDRSLPAQGAVRSATEWQIRQADLQEAIGSPLGRLQQELLRPLFARLLFILSERGLFDPINLDGGEADIQTTGSLAQAASLRKVEALGMWGQMSSQLAGPELFQTQVKVENIPEYLRDALGVDPSLMRTDEEKEQAAAMLAQQQMAQQQDQQVRMEAAKPGGDIDPDE